MTVLFIGFVLSAILLVIYRRHAPDWGLIDRPNDRSQHVTPTVVGGGIAVAIAVAVQLAISGAVGGDIGALFGTSVETGALLGAAESGAMLNRTLMFSGAVVFLALVGLTDDRFNLPSSARLIIYTLVSSGIVWLELPGLAIWLLLLAALALVWVINLVNFMDGLDGFALSQALSVAFGMAMLSILGPFDALGPGFLALILVAALLPLMWFNWPPASMFMGDAGAVFLGFYLGVLGLKAAAVDLRLGAAWLILMMPFLVDATLTLIIRLAAGLPPHVAHRDHAYQRLVRRSGSALPIVLGLLALQSVWQFPLAWWAVSGSYSPILAVIFSAIPTGLVLVYLRCTE